MLNAVKKAREINKFRLVAIPKPRDLFARYGERYSTSGVSATSKDVISTPSVSCHTVIGQLSAGQSILDDLPK